MHGNFLNEIVLVVAAALFGGISLSTLKQPPILGYIMVGIILGPSGMGVIQSRDHVSELSQLGVLLLLFVIGMELNLRSFKKIWGVSTFCAILQITLSVLVTLSLSQIFNWSFHLSLLLGFVISVSSTAIVVKILESQGEYVTDTGQTAIGILIAQDLAIVPMIIMIRSSGASALDGLALVLKLSFAIGLIIILIFYLSQRQRIRLPLFDRIVGETDLIPLVSLMVCFGASLLSGMIGLSEAYGAFLAGLVLGNCHERNMILETVKPIQSTLLMTFCLSIGLLLDVQFVIEYWQNILTLLFVVTVIKTLVNLGALTILRVPFQQAFFISVSLGQIGEFAFLLVSVAQSVKILSPFGEKLIIALTVLSLITSPLWMLITKRYCDPKELSYSIRHFWSLRHLLTRAFKRRKKRLPLTYRPIDQNDDRQ